LQHLALKRLHSAFEQGKVEAKSSEGAGGRGDASRLQWYVPWTHSLSSAVKAALPTPTN